MIHFAVSTERQGYIKNFTSPDISPRSIPFFGWVVRVDTSRNEFTVKIWEKALQELDKETNVWMPEENRYK